ncbi:hypothetical protein U9M48_032152 [Paspalum notatum var. saurae]|uniref:Reverse transcriptase domain-containing protein n=1 Tax=Paspalum notatum var. saurae TaxID=547442 RepID=A0AAQ3U8T0_PASNO
MEQLVYTHFKHIFAIVPTRASSLNLGNIGFQASDRSSIDGPFTEHEVWEAIKDLPTDRALRPDGFTGAFYKVAWPIIKADVMDALRAFYLGNCRGFEGLNNGLIILLSKMAGAEQPADFRAIAMVHNFGKLVSKLLARRLAPLLPRLVSCNQTAFVRGRTLHDSYKFVQSIAREYRRRKMGRILFKIDISKAFDTLSWAFLLEVLEACGFSVHWRNWVSILLSLAASCILLNGQPGRSIRHRRGVRQGDSLSPMLFILAVDALNRLFDEAVRRGVLSGPGIPRVNYHCSLYADDIVLFFKASTVEAMAIKRILQAFGEASGLVANLAKCSITPICVDENTTAAIAQVLECRVANFPIRYLGLPLSSGPLPRAEVHKVVEAVQRKLPPCHGPLMARSGRLVLIKSVLMAMPIFAMMGNRLPAWAKEEIDAMCRRFLWAVDDQSVKGKCLVSWPVIARPKPLGGLGSRISGCSALRCKHAGSGCNELMKSESGRDCQSRRFFDASIMIKVGNGKRFLFWSDKWPDGQAVCTLAPALVSAVARHDLRTLTVAEGLTGARWIRGITSGLIVAVIEEYIELWAKLAHVTLREGVEDQVVWRWTTDGQYSAKSACLALHHGAQEFPGHKLI